MNYRPFERGDLVVIKNESAFRYNNATLAVVLKAKDRDDDLYQDVKIIYINGDDKGEKDWRWGYALELRSETI